MGVTVQEHPSPNHEPRPAATAIDTLVLHYTGMKTAKAALDRLCDATAKVSAHYLIDEAGQVYALVPEARRAWHAGEACWQGARNVNDRAIGIELVNPGHEFGYRPFPEPQMYALEALLHDILARHPIPAARVLGHSDIAPGRKEDPGEYFDWARLARAGIGLWPVWPEATSGPAGGEPTAAAAKAAAAKAAAPIDEIQALLHQYGYDVPLSGLADRATQKVVSAFQRHFRPERIDGVADGETLARLRTLLNTTT